jgi:hypothetical protein
MMCLCRFTDSNCNHTDEVFDGGGGGCALEEQSVLSAHFCCQHKNALQNKIKLFEKEKKDLG